MNTMSFDVLDILQKIWHEMNFYKNLYIDQISVSECWKKFKLERKI